VSYRLDEKWGGKGENLAVVDLVPNFDLDFVFASFPANRMCMMGL
jgi:hypothetical protein